MGTGVTGQNVNHLTEPATGHVTILVQLTEATIAPVRVTHRKHRAVGKQEKPVNQIHMVCMGRYIYHCKNTA